MSDLMTLIIKKIEEKKTVNQICEELNLTRKKLYYYMMLLKNRGYAYKSKYYCNGEILYDYDSFQTINMYNNFDNLEILMGQENTTLKTLVISDLHFGNEFERIDLINEIYDYAIKNDIHIILCCGDLLDGTFTHERQIIEGVKQIEYFIKNYPYDKNIVTLSVLGDHDFSILREYNYDPREIIMRHRHDIGIGGYNYSYVRIKKEIISLHHHLNGSKKTNNGKITLNGHLHTFSTRFINQNNLDILVPALCDINTVTPSAIEMCLDFESGKVKTVNLKQLMVINGNVVPVNEIEYMMKWPHTNAAEDVEVDNSKKLIL